VVGELAARTGKLEHPLVRLDDVEIGAGHPRREAEEACLVENVFGSRAIECQGRNGLEPPVGYLLGKSLGAEVTAHRLPIERHPMDHGGIFKEKRNEVDAREAPAKARPRVELRFRQPRPRAAGSFIASEGVEQGCRPHTCRTLMITEFGNV
jgi:hypothetical protein